MTKKKELILEGAGEAETQPGVDGVTIEVEVETLRARVLDLEAERDALRARLEALLAPVPEIARPRSCINCGQRSQPVTWDGELFACPLCKYTWPPEAEQAPFRRV